MPAEDATKLFGAWRQMLAELAPGAGSDARVRWGAFEQCMQQAYAAYKEANGMLPPGGAQPGYPRLRSRRAQTPGRRALTSYIPLA